MNFLNQNRLWAILPLLCLLAYEANCQFPTERHPVLWPFAQTSIWNMPIGSDAVYVPAGIEPSPVRGLTIDEDILALEPDAPLKNVLAHDAGWDNTL